MPPEIAIALALMAAPAPGKAETPAVSICPCKPCKCGTWCFCNAPDVAKLKPYVAPRLTLYTMPDCPPCAWLKTAFRTWPSLTAGYRLVIVESIAEGEAAGVHAWPTLRRSDRPGDMVGYRGDLRALQLWLK